MEPGRGWEGGMEMELGGRICNADIAGVNMRSPIGFPGALLGIVEQYPKVTSNHFLTYFGSSIGHVPVQLRTGLPVCFKEQGDRALGLITKISAEYHVTQQIKHISSLDEKENTLLRTNRQDTVVVY